MKGHVVYMYAYDLAYEIDLQKAKDLLQMTKLLTVFDTYNDEAKAVQALG